MRLFQSLLEGATNSTTYLASRIPALISWIFGNKTLWSGFIPTALLAIVACLALQRTGDQIEINTADRTTRARFSGLVDEREQELARVLRRNNIDAMPVHPDRIKHHLADRIQHKTSAIVYDDEIPERACLCVK